MEIKYVNWPKPATSEPVYYPPYSENSMRYKPTYPQSLIEHNISSVRPYPNNWVRTFDEWKFFKQEKQFRKRCVFDANDDNKQIHMRSLDSLTNRHLLDTNLKPNEDYIFQVLGRKANPGDQRNGVPEFSPGDKSYKAVEYSPAYFSKNTHSRAPLKSNKPKKEIDLLKALNIRPNSSMTVSSEIDADPLRRNEEIEAVRALDSWKAAVSLKAPFKVIDVGDKGSKYRPKVTK